MKRTLRSIALFITMIIMMGMLMSCGEKVEVPPAHVGKRSTANGLQEKVIPPSKFRLAFVWPGQVGDSLILCEASDYAVLETMKIYMPEDKLNLDVVEIRGTFAITSDAANVNKIFDRITATSIASRLYKITIAQVYKTYAEPIIRETARTILTQYSIEHVMMNREAIGQELSDAIKLKLKGTPIAALYIGLADLQPPEVVLKAQIKAKEREIAITEADNEKMVRLKIAEGDLEVANKQQEVDLKEAETQVLVAQKMDEGVSEAFVTQRALKIMDKMATSDNKVYFMPMEAMKNPAILIGAMQKAR